MASAKMTLVGMYNWDDSLFNDMVLPEGIDKDLLIDSLLLQGGEFEVLYASPAFMKRSIRIWSNKWYRTFAEWLRGTQETWNPIYNYDRFEESRDEDRKQESRTTTADYNDSRTVNLEDKRTADLEDKRTADLEDKRTADLQDKRTADLQDKRTADLQDKRTADLMDERTADLTEETTFDNSDTTSQTTAGSTEHLVAAYDSATYSPSSKDNIDNGVSKIEHAGTVTNTTTGTDTNTQTGTDTMDHTGTDTMDHTGTDTMDHTGTDTMTHTGTDTTTTTGTDTMNHTGTDKTNHKGTLSDMTGTEANTNMHTAHMYGNIGVTTSAAMLKEFYDISKWNLYEHICDVFIGELLIPVY